MKRHDSSIVDLLSGTKFSNSCHRPSYFIKLPLRSKLLAELILYSILEAKIDRQRYRPEILSKRRRES